MKDEAAIRTKIIAELRRYLSLQAEGTRILNPGPFSHGDVTDGERYQAQRAYDQSAAAYAYANALGWALEMDEIEWRRMLRRAQEQM